MNSDDHTFSRLSARRRSMCHAYCTETRASGHRNPTHGPTAGRGPWTVQEFADECGADERTIRNWRNGKRVLGTNLATIERLLFGPDQVAAAEDRRVREAHARLRSGDRESEPGPHHPRR